MRKLFGTDGVRGVANKDLTPQIAFQLGQAAGWYLRERGLSRRTVVGRDTRKSGSMLGAALASGLCSTGIEVTTLGVAPTPAIAYAARTGDFGLGVIISASHNPAPDNGIKFVAHDGRKLADEEEAVVESLMHKASDLVIGGEIGAIVPDSLFVEHYLDMLVGIVPKGLTGLRIAVDCAHGAAYDLAPRTLKRLGAEVFVTGDQPDGTNINAEGGATKPQRIQRFTREKSCHVGVAFDGDADRCILSDEIGGLINGDRLMACWALQRKKEGRLNPPVVVGTVMSNGGMEDLLRKHEIELVRTQVGDKYVAQRMDDLGALVGGEQSGHIIFPEHGPTGDGLATMLEALNVLRASNGRGSALSHQYEPWPQLMVNIRLASRDGWDENSGVRNALAEGKLALVGRGRLVVRPSGTQPVLRVMVEADTVDLRDSVVDSVVDAVVTELNGTIEGRVDLTHALGD